MKRTLSVLLIGLFVLVVMAAPRPAAAQFGYGPTPRIISVSSTGSGNRTELIAAGQTQTSLDHSGPSLTVTAWFPANHTCGPQVLFNGNIYSGLMQRESSALVRDGVTIIGFLLRYSVYGSYGDGTCYVKTEYRAGMRTGYVRWHTLKIK